MTNNLLSSTLNSGLQRYTPLLEKIYKRVLKISLHDFNKKMNKKPRNSGALDQVDYE